MAGLDADTSVYALSRPQGEGITNPLDAMGKLVGIQGGMNQNALFQQEFRAKQALGPIAQASVDPKTGQMDWGKFAVNVSSDPNAAFLAPQILQSVAQKQYLDQQTLNMKLTNAKDMFNSYASALTPLLSKGDSVTVQDVIGAANGLHAQGTVDDDHLMQFLSQLPTDDQKASVTLPTGQVVQRSALAQYIKGQTMMAATRGENIGKVLGEISPTDTGQAQVFTQRNPITGEVNTVSGNAAVIPKGPTPADANALQPTINAQGQTVMRPRYQVAPMVDSGGNPSYSSPPASAQPPVAKQSPFASQFQQESGSKIAEYADGVNQGAHQAQQALGTLNRQLSLLDKFRAGGGAYFRTEMAQAMQSVPVPKELQAAKEDLIGKIQGGNNKDALAAAQEFEKYAAIGAMQSLIQAQGSHYRPAAIEYQTIFKNFPRANIDPKASRDMITLTRHFLQQNLLEQQAMEGYRAKFGPEGMQSWPAVWSRILAKNGWLGIDKNLYGRFGGKSWDSVEGSVSGR